jgi:hypothetical protein
MGDSRGCFLVAPESKFPKECLHIPPEADADRARREGASKSKSGLLREPPQRPLRRPLPWSSERGGAGATASPLRMAAVPITNVSRAEQGPLTFLQRLVERKRDLHFAQVDCAARREYKETS